MAKKIEKTHLEIEFEKFRADYAKNTATARKYFVDGMMSIAQYSLECSAPINGFIENNHLNDKNMLHELDVMLCEWLFPAVRGKIA